MADALSILAIAVLLPLIVYSLIKQREGARQVKSDADARLEGGDLQHDRSMRRRAEARAAHDADG